MTKTRQPTSTDRQDRMAWWRAYHGFPSHPRWLEVARKSKQPVPVVFSVSAWLIDHASRNTDRGSCRGFNVGQCAAFLWLDDADVTAVYETLKAVGWIHEDRILSWDERQVFREDTEAAARKREQRERDRQRQEQLELGQSDAAPVTPCHAMSHTVTQCHTPEAEAEADSEITRQAAALRPVPPPALPLSDEKGFEITCREALGTFKAPPASSDFAPMLGLGVERERALTVIRAEVARGRKPVGSWSLWAQIVTERTSRGPARQSSAQPRPSPPGTIAMRDPHGPRVYTKAFGHISAAFLRQERDAGRWSPTYGDPAAIPPDTPAPALNVVDLDQFREDRVA